MSEHHILPTVEAIFQSLPIARIGITRLVEIVWMDNVDFLEVVIFYTKKGKNIKKTCDETSFFIGIKTQSTILECKVIRGT